MTFHHDPEHDDDTLERLLDEARAGAAFPFEIVPGTEGLGLEVGDAGADGRAGAVAPTGSRTGLARPHRPDPARSGCR